MAVYYPKMRHDSRDGSMDPGSGGGSRRGAAAVVGGIATIVVASLLIPLVHNPIWLAVAVLIGIGVYLSVKPYVY